MRRLFTIPCAENPMSKVAKNLYLDPEALKRAEEYGRLHRTSLSQLVNDFFHSLSLTKSDKSEMSPALKRLIGAGVPRDPGTPPATIEDYRKYLVDKYGQDK